MRSLELQEDQAFMVAEFILKGSPKKENLNPLFTQV